MAELDPLSATFPAIEARLRTFFKADRWGFHVVDDPMSDEEFKAITRRTPLLALGWRQFNPSSKSVGRRFQGAFGLRLTIVVKHPNGARLRFMGDERGPGLFPSICGAALLINGFTAEGVGTFSVTACAQAYAQGFSNMNTAIATMDIGIDVAIGDVTGDFAAAPAFLTMLSTFEPWPEDQGRDRDEPFDVRPAP
jgi:hypothetical protein